MPGSLSAGSADVGAAAHGQDGAGIGPGGGAAAIGARGGGGPGGNSFWSKINGGKGNKSAGPFTIREKDRKRLITGAGPPATDTAGTSAVLPRPRPLHFDSKADVDWSELPSNVVLWGSTHRINVRLLTPICTSQIKEHWLCNKSE